MLQNQGVNKVILVGQLYGIPQWKMIGKDRFFCFQLITTETFNRKGVAETHSEFHFLRMPEQIANDLPQEPSEDTELYIEGKICTQASVDAQGIKRYDTTVIVNKMYAMVKAQNLVPIVAG